MQKEVCVGLMKTNQIEIPGIIQIIGLTYDETKKEMQRYVEFNDLEIEWYRIRKVKQ